MGCPSAGTVQSLADGTLSDRGREEILDHADACEDCRQLLAALARQKTRSENDPAISDTQWVPRSDAVPAQAAPSARPALIARGTRIGRYEVESLLGTGGLGVVYAASDPELGRRVAIKLLKPGAGSDVEGTQVRLMREAQAMARVTHPNVVPVFDVGRFEDRVFIAMALIEGRDLRAWWTERPRRVSEIVDAFLEAGQGLAAAHAAGIVHRDFKPENVLVGHDGRICVTDFGLARGAAGGEPEAPVADAATGRHSLLDSALTRADVILGTPAYMAPEQHLGEPVDVRSDQFAFCVALHEALHGARPFPGTDYTSLRDAVVRGELELPPPGRRVPKTLRRIVVRGLARAPGDRFAGMEALLHALGRDRTRLPRRVAAAAVALLAVILTAGIGDWVVRERLVAVAHVSFAATRVQALHAMAFQYETFSAVAALSALVPSLGEVAGARDRADFGLGARADDEKQLETLHAALRDADWESWAPATRRGHLAIADYKGRLLYSTGNPGAFGGDARKLAAVAAAYRSGAGAEILRRDDPRLGEIGLQPRDQPSPGLVIVFARASMQGDVPQSVFIQLVEGRRFLADVAPDGALLRALVAPDGAAEGDLPATLARARLPEQAAPVELHADGHPWLVQSYAVPDIDPAQPPLATIRLARRADVGLAGLFPHARVVLWSAAALALMALLGAVLSIRSARILLRS